MQSDLFIISPMILYYQPTSIPFVPNNNLVTLCKLRLAVRLLYLGNLNLRRQLFCYPPEGSSTARPSMLLAT